IKVDPTTPGKTPIMADGKIKPEWLKLFQDFPDRWVIGSDQHYGTRRPPSPSRWQATVLLLNQLPPDLQRKIATENALKLYSNLGKTQQTKVQKGPATQRNTLCTA